MRNLRITAFLAPLLFCVVYSACELAEPGGNEFQNGMSMGNEIPMNTMDEMAELPPVDAVDDSATSESGVPIAIDILSNDDRDLDQIVDFSQAVNQDGAEQPGSVQFNVDSNSLDILIYTPPEGFTGIVTFTYTIEGVGESFANDSTSTATVTVTVTAPPEDDCSDGIDNDDDGDVDCQDSADCCEDPVCADIPACLDGDDDGISDDEDNCPSNANADQADDDEDGVGDACEPPSVSIENVLFVDIDATGANDGSSWADALTDLQAALDQSFGPGDTEQVWVAEGTYRPVGPDGDRSASFQLVNGIEVLGGFAGVETDPDDRDYVVNQTILSGDLNGDDEGDVDDPSRAENSEHVVLGFNTGPTAILDGFIITAGNSGGTGGALLNNPGSPTIRNCVFLHNFSSGSGGAIFNFGSSPLLEFCAFLGNASDNGGAIYNTNNSRPNIINCLFSGNTATVRGGALNHVSGLVIIRNSTFYGNSAGSIGGGVALSDDQVIINNSILWENRANETTAEAAQIGKEGLANGDDFATIVDYSCIQGLTGGLGGTGNIGEEPLFVSPAGDDGVLGTLDDDLRLMTQSPGIDAGANGFATTEIDLDGNPRRADDPDTVDTGEGDPPVADMGAYEFQ
jgi:hypothetical protein